MRVGSGGRGKGHDTTGDGAVSSLSPLHVPVYTHLCSASVKVLQGPGHIPGHLQPGLGGEGEGGGEVGIQGPMWHEGVEKTEVWAITAVA